jgi:ribosomal protein S8E
MPSSQPSLERRKTLMKTAVIGIAVALHSLAASAQTATERANAAGRNAE